MRLTAFDSCWTVTILVEWISDRGLESTASNSRADILG